MRERETRERERESSYKSLATFVLFYYKLGTLKEAEGEREEAERQEKAGDLLQKLITVTQRIDLAERANTKREREREVDNLCECSCP